MAQTLKFGNGTWATKKDSILAYSDTNENYKPLPFNYTGAGKGTRVNKEGLIEVVENDRPRIDYLDSEDGVFLLENAATNSITYSEDFTQWTIDGQSSIVSNSIISPDGTLNATKLIAGSTSARQAVTLSNLSSGNLAISVFAKKEGYSVLQFSDGRNPNSFVNFDLNNGIVGSSNGMNGDITSLGNDWYRCVATYNSVLDMNLFRLSIAENLTDGRLVNFSGNGTSGIYVWGAQVEAGNLSSYIPTQGGIQTRVQETASGSGNSEVFNYSEGILYVEGSLINDDGTSNNITLGDNTFSNNRMMLLFSNGIANRITARFDSSGSDVTLNADGYDLTLNHKVVLKYKANDIAIWVDGFEVNSGNSFSAPTLLNRIDFYNPFNSGQDNFYGKTKEISYYDTALTDLELETLTSYRSWLSMVKELNLNVIYNG